MDRVIEVRVSGSYLCCDSHTAGVQGEANAVALRITFDGSWDGLAKTVTFWNARGENETKRLLTADCLEDIAASGRVYLVSIPGEAMTAAGKCRFAIDGYIAGQRQRSIYAQLVVRPAGNSGDSTVEDPTPTQAEQLQTQIDVLQEELQTKAVRAETAAAAARDSQNAAKASEEVADYEALLAKSYAVGGTGLRAFEDQDNARYYAEEAERIAVGGFATQVYVQQEITAAFDCGRF